MKKTVCFICTVLMLCVCSLTCFAATNTSGTGNESGSVYAKYEEKTTGTYSEKAVNGKAEVILPDNQKKTVTNISDNTLTLIVIPILKTDTKAWEWFSGCMKDTGTNILPFDICFFDGSGNHVSVNKTTTVTISTTNEMEHPIACSISTDGNVTLLNSTSDGKEIHFTTDDQSYYVLAEKINPSEPGHAPQTGDNGRMLFWAALLFLSGAGLTILGIGRNRSKASK